MVELRREPEAVLVRDVLRFALTDPQLLPAQHHLCTMMRVRDRSKLRPAARSFRRRRSSPVQADFLHVLVLAPSVQVLSLIRFRSLSLRSGRYIRFRS